MSKIVINVTDLSKKYIIRHDNDAKYSALRDLIANKIKSGFKKNFSEREEFYALRDINFDVKQGERIGIIGRNGAGKSTLLKVLSQITEPTTGKIKIKGRIASLLEVGTGFHPELSGRENIFLNGAILGMSRSEIRKKFDEIVAFSEVEKFLDTPVKRYSSGMYVKLAFAVAAHLEPEILVVDEVLAVGDIEFQKKCLGKMEDVSNNHGRTVLFVSHNMATIKALCTSGMLLSNGKLIGKGKIDDIMQQYLNANHLISNDGVIPKGMATYNTGVMRFVSAKLKNESTDNDLYYLEPIEFILNLESTKSYKDIIIDITINNAQGIEVVHACNKYEDYYKEYPIKEGMNCINLSIQNLLQPGSYSITIGVHDLDGTSLDYIESLLKINILKMAKEGSGYMFNNNLGMIRLESTWKITN